MAARRIFVIGATGAQGASVSKGLLKGGAYSLRILTRNPSGASAKELIALGDVETVQGSFTDEALVREGLRGCWGAYVNVDGFNVGEKAETFWTIRIYELAIEEGIQFFVFGSLDYAYKKSGYNPKYRAGHYDGKGRMAEWILSQNRDNPKMGAAVFTTGPYIEMNFASSTIMTPRVVDGVVTWTVPMGKGAVPFVALDDCQYYAKWIFDHPERSNGINLEVAIDHLNYDQITAAFTAVTGKPAQWVDVDLDTYFSYFPNGGNAPAARSADAGDPATMSLKDNFGGFWRIWQDSGSNTGVVQRDYALLDEIFPGRIKTAEEFIRRENEKHPEGLFEYIEKGLSSLLKGDS